MLTALRRLEHWKDQFKSSGEALKSTYAEDLRKDPALEIDQDSRTVAHHAYKVKLLYDSGVVDKTLVNNVLTKETKRDFLLDVVRWTDIAVAQVKGMKYDSKIYDFYEKLPINDSFMDRVKAKW